MAEAIQKPPRTIMEVYKMLPEGTLAELIDNNIYMAPTPLFNHQITSTELVTAIHSFLKKNKRGLVIAAPFDVYLDETSNAVQPDIIVVLNEQLNIIDKGGHIHGVPAILIEILSHGNKNHDLIRKKDLYERFGVREYHVVDPETKLVLTFELINEKYQKTKETIGTLSSTLLEQEFSF